MFDPFGDFETHGYLRNIENIKDLSMLKRQEHVFLNPILRRLYSFFAT